MKDTCFFPPDDKRERLATVYTCFPEEGLKRFPETPITEGAFTFSPDYPIRGPKKLFSGGAGLVSTAEDYARFCRLMLDGGKAGNTRLIGRKAIELMTPDALGTLSSDRGFGLGFGVEGVKQPLPELGSAGQYYWSGFFYTRFVIDPKEQMSVIFMCQRYPETDLNLDRLVQALAFQAIID